MHFRVTIDAPERIEAFDKGSIMGSSSLGDRLRLRLGLPLTWEGEIINMMSRHSQVNPFCLGLLPSMTSPAVGNSRPSPDLKPSPEAIGAHSFFILLPIPVPSPVDGVVSWPLFSDPNADGVGRNISVADAGDDSME